MGEIKNNKKCVICGSAYSYCPSCSRDQGKPSWYAVFCSDTCNDIYDIVTKYRDGIYSIAEAYEKIKEVDLSKLEDEGFNKGTKKQIYEILAYKEDKYVVLADKNEEVVSDVAEPVVKDDNEEKADDAEPETKQENKGNYYNKHFKKNK